MLIPVRCCKVISVISTATLPSARLRMLSAGYDALQAATDAALAIARPGVTAKALYQAMAEAMQIEGSDVGRFGHGLGMQLTEWPSLAAWDDTVITANMVITLEPSIAIDGGGIMVTEENIVIRDGAPEWLSRRAPAEIPLSADSFSRW